MANCYVVFLHWTLEDESSLECLDDVAHRLLGEDWSARTVNIVNLLRGVTTHTHTYPVSVYTWLDTCPGLLDTCSPDPDCLSSIMDVLTVCCPVSVLIPSTPQ